MGCWGTSHTYPRSSTENTQTVSDDEMPVYSRRPIPIPKSSKQMVADEEIPAARPEPIPSLQDMLDTGVDISAIEN